REILERGQDSTDDSDGGEDVVAPDGKEWNREVVVSHQRALDRVAEVAAAGAPFSQEIVLELHKILMGELILSAGEYRECTLKYKGLLIASPPETLKERMEALVSLVNSGMQRAEAKKDQLAWRVHHEFITIHPFIEGNGRMSRLLLNLVRLRAGLEVAIVRFEDREKYSKAIVEFQQQKIAKAKQKTSG
ncbi:Fic family protein, partial [bacterium]|nr:Fic family protein [bacterium]